MKHLLLALLLLPLLAPRVYADLEYTDPATQPLEYGKVRWLRDLDIAVGVAKESGKCIYLQFQEVPG